MGTEQNWNGTCCFSVADSSTRYAWQQHNFLVFRYNSPHTGVFATIYPSKSSSRLHFSMVFVVAESPQGTTMLALKDRIPCTRHEDHAIINGALLK